MWLWGILISGLAVAGILAALMLRGRNAEQREVQERRRRFLLRDTGERVALTDQQPAQWMPQPEAELRPSPAPERVEAARPAKVSGRIVQTPEGEAIITTPPFALRDSIFTSKTGRFINALTRRVPPWVIVFPKVRLDSILTPTRPDGRDPADWRDWRRRVRVRSIDLVLCDRRSWKPLVAVMFDQRTSTDARRIAGGQDRMIDEVLQGAGLAILHLSGNIETDWPLISPYVDETILPHTTEEQILDASDRTNRVDADSAVTLLRMDQDKGWVLE